MAIHRCSNCGGLNRVPDQPTGKQPRCGRCKQSLDTSGAPQPVDGAALERAVRGSTVPILVDVWAPWCGPCRVMAPVLDQVARAHAGQVLVLKLDSDQNPQVSARYQIQGIPTLLLFEGGRLVDRQVGALPRPALEDWLRRHRIADARAAS